MAGDVGWNQVNAARESIKGDISDIKKNEDSKKNSVTVVTSIIRIDQCANETAEGNSKYNVESATIEVAGEIEIYAKKTINCYEGIQVSSCNGIIVSKNRETVSRESKNSETVNREKENSASKNSVKKISDSHEGIQASYMENMIRK